MSKRTNKRPINLDQDGECAANLEDYGTRIVPVFYDDDPENLQLDSMQRQHIYGNNRQELTEIYTY